MRSASRDKRERHWPRPFGFATRTHPIVSYSCRNVNKQVWNTLQTMTFQLALSHSLLLPLVRRRRNSSQILFYPSLDGANFCTSLSPTWVCHISRGSISPLGVRLSHTHTLPSERIPSLRSIGSTQPCFALVGRVTGCKSFSLST